MRLLIVVGLLSLGFWTGGWAGLFTWLLICGILGVMFPMRRDFTPVEDREKEWDRISPARRGSEIDPTRPTRADYEGMKEFQRKGR